MASPGKWDARLHALIGTFPASPADRWLIRLSTAANHGRLWLGIAVLLGLKKGSLRRGALRGIGSMGVSSLLVNLVLKRIFGRVRPDMANLRRERRPGGEPGAPSFPPGDPASAAAIVPRGALGDSLARAAR